MRHPREFASRMPGRSTFVCEVGAPDDTPEDRLCPVCDGDGWTMDSVIHFGQHPPRIYDRRDLCDVCNGDGTK